MRAFFPNPKTKFKKLKPLCRFDRQDLAAFVIAARRTGGVRADAASALAAADELRGVPAIGGLARAQPHFRGFAFWNSHFVTSILICSTRPRRAIRLRRCLLQWCSAPGLC